MSALALIVGRYPAMARAMFSSIARVAARAAFSSGLKT